MKNLLRTIAASAFLIFLSAGISFAQETGSSAVTAEEPQTSYDVNNGQGQPAASSDPAIQNERRRVQNANANQLRQRHAYNNYLLQQRRRHAYYNNSVDPVCKPEAQQIRTRNRSASGEATSPRLRQRTGTRTGQ